LREALIALDRGKGAATMDRYFASLGMLGKHEVKGEKPTRHLQ
jgi:hypothetical protein